jgi:hypothetical protein
MAYIGSEPNYGTVASQRFTGDGSTTSFGLTQTVPDGESIIVTIGNVVQEPGASAAYTASGNTLAFSAAPDNGDVIMVRYLGRSIDTPSSYTNVIRFKYVATASQTVFTGADINSAILAFSGPVVDVFLNGVHLDETDYTISNGDTVTLATGATLNDEIVIIAYRAQTFADVVAASTGGTFAGGITAPNFQTTVTKVHTAVFRTNNQTVTQNTTIATAENALAIGPLSIDPSATITVDGNLTIL